MASMITYCCKNKFINESCAEKRTLLERVHSRCFSVLKRALTNLMFIFPVLSATLLRGRGLGGWGGGGGRVLPYMGYKGNSAVLVINRVWFFHFSLELGRFF